jgi:hypothetical protein
MGHAQVMHSCSTLAAACVTHIRGYAYVQHERALDNAPAHTKQSRHDARAAAVQRVQQRRRARRAQVPYLLTKGRFGV